MWISRLSLFEASNSVLSKVLGQSDGKIECCGWYEESS